LGRPVNEKTPDRFSFRDHADAIERFRIGFSDRTLGFRLPAKKLQAGAEIRARLQQIGILRQTGHEQFNGCVVFPVFDAPGNVCEIYGRKINDILVSKGDAVHVDTFDLYNARCRASFVKLAAAEVAVDAEVIKKDVGRVLLKLEELQDQQIADALTPRDRARKLSDRDHDAALELLKDPNLLQRITADFDACGVVGEETNRLAGYLAATSRKLDKPLAVLIQSSSSAGKTSLMDSVLRFMPPEEQVKYSAMTGQSLFYMGRTNLKHKILAISEEEGVGQPSAYIGAFGDLKSAKIAAYVRQWEEQAVMIRGRRKDSHSAAR
jgi:hypothetical protein